MRRFERFSEVFRAFLEVFRDFLEVFRGPHRDPQRQISSQRLSVLLPLIVLPLELSPSGPQKPLAISETLRFKGAMDSRQRFFKRC